MNIICLVLSHKIEMCYNSYDSTIYNYPYRDVVGCSRCKKVWIINEEKKEIEK